MVIPAFAVGRAQALLYHLATQAGGRIARDLPVFLDSPMASGAVDVYLRHAGDQRLSAADARAAFGVATYVTEVEQSKALDSSPMPKIIVSAQRHDHRRARDPSSEALPARSAQHGAVRRFPGRGHARCWTAPPRSRSMAAMCPCAPRSTACRCCRRTRMPTRSCAGCAGSSARGNLHRAWRAGAAAAPAHQGRAGLALPGGGAERRGGAGLTGGAALPARPPRSIVPGSSARARTAVPWRARRTGRRRRTPGLRRGDQLPGPQGVAAQAFGRHCQSGAGAGRVQRGLIVGQDQRRRFGIARVDLLPVGRQRRGGAAGRSAAGPGAPLFSLPLRRAHQPLRALMQQLVFHALVRNPRRRHRHVDHALGQRRQQGGRRRRRSTRRPRRCRPANGGSNSAMKPLVAPTCATPASAPPAPRASSMPSSASRCGPACRSSSTAAGVGASPRGNRVNSVAPRQQLHMARHGGLGQRQRGRGARDRAVPVDADEAAQIERYDINKFMDQRKTMN